MRNAKKLLQSVKKFEVLLYETLSQFNHDDLIVRRLCYNFYELGPNVVRLQYAINVDETYKYLQATLKACVVTEYNLKLLGECKGIDVSNILPIAEELEIYLVKQIKSIKRKIKTDAHLQSEYHERLYKVVMQQLNQFDMCSLLKKRYPEDIIVHETYKIANQIIPNANAEYITCVISKVMQENFGVDFDKTKFLPYAEKIREELKIITSSLTPYGEFAVYYKVVFSNGGYEYTYLYGGNDVCVGDCVLVPTGKEHIKTPAHVVNISTVFRKNGVIPERDINLKSIIRKISEDEYEESIFTENYTWD